MNQLPTTNTTTTTTNDPAPEATVPFSEQLPATEDWLPGSLLPASKSLEDYPVLSGLAVTLVFSTSLAGQG